MDSYMVEPFIEHQGERRFFWLSRTRAIGEKILIAGKGGAGTDSHADRTIVFLDLKRAFGTGGHGTTEGCMLALEKFLSGGETVLDVGSGTGILAITAFKLGARHVTAIDIDKAACRETTNNLALNGAGDRIDVIEGGIDAVSNRFDVVAANLRTPILVELMDELVEKLNERGIAIFSGILERELPCFLSFLEEHPMEIREIKRIHGWMTLVAKKRSVDAVDRRL